MTAAALPLSVWVALVPLLGSISDATMPRVLDRIVESVLFLPSSGVDITPERLGIDAREVFLRTEDDIEIHAFDLPAPHGEDRAVLFLHGNAGNASHRLPNASELAALGARVLLLDYRGYGKSHGTPTLDGVVADARAGLAYLVDQGVPEKRVVLFGRSLGGAVAVQLARGRPLGGVILESTWSSLADVAREAFGPLIGPVAAWAAGDRFDSALAISELDSPLLSLHGDRDEIVPYELGRALFEVAPGHKRFETILGAGHNDTVQVGGRAYFEHLEAFLNDFVPVGAAR